MSHITAIEGGDLMRGTSLSLNEDCVPVRCSTFTVTNNESKASMSQKSWTLPDSMFNN